MLYKLTNPVMMPLHRLIPNWRNFDVAGVLLAWLLSAIKLALLFAVFGQGLRVAGLMVMALADLIDFVLLLYLVLIFVRALLSFISVERSNPIVPLVIQLTEPLLRGIRRRVPAMGALDFSPAIVMLAILLMRVLLVAPLLDIGKQLAQAAM
jgi:YggT family protein